ncbi:MAG: YARHG domain-containing protein [Lachnospiraceae bacterium]|nr:YARHG domain-containing protein [Lachnospiraceae bacterium]
MVEDPANGGDIDQSDSTDGMIIPDSDRRKLTDDDLKKLDIGELRLARNEIYARHGRMFKAEDLQTHFGAMDWYMPSVEADDFDERILNEYEKYNLELIGKYEKKLKK